MVLSNHENASWWRATMRAQMVIFMVLFMVSGGLHGQEQVDSNRQKSLSIRPIGSSEYLEALESLKRLPTLLSQQDSRLFVDGGYMDLATKLSRWSNEELVILFAMYDEQRLSQEVKTPAYFSARYLLHILFVFPEGHHFHGAPLAWNGDSPSLAHPVSQEQHGTVYLLSAACIDFVKGRESGVTRRAFGDGAEKDD